MLSLYLHILQERWVIISWPIQCCRLALAPPLITHCWLKHLTPPHLPSSTPLVSVCVCVCPALIYTVILFILISSVFSLCLLFPVRSIASLCISIVSPYLSPHLSHLHYFPFLFTLSVSLSVSLICRYLQKLKYGISAMTFPVSCVYVAVSHPSRTERI